MLLTVYLSAFCKNSCKFANLLSMESWLESRSRSISGRRKVSGDLGRLTNLFCLNSLPEANLALGRSFDNSSRFLPLLSADPGRSRFLEREEELFKIRSGFLDIDEDLLNLIELDLESRLGQVYKSYLNDLRSSNLASRS